MTKPRPRLLTRRQWRKRNSRGVASQAMITKRMRETWIDGFGLIPQGATELHLQRTRTAMQTIAADDAFWADLKTLCALRSKATKLMEELRDKKR